MSSEESASSTSSVVPEAQKDQTVDIEESQGEEDKSGEFTEISQISEIVESQIVQEDDKITDPLESSSIAEAQTVQEDDKNEMEVTGEAEDPTGDAEPDNSAEQSAEESTEESTGDESPRKLTVDDIKTAPMDFRFPTTNQAKHCFTRYVEYHKCVQAKGEGNTECDKYARYYRSLCPSEWVERWNEQRENGTFAGPL